MQGGSEGAKLTRSEYREALNIFARKAGAREPNPDTPEHLSQAPIRTTVGHRFLSTQGTTVSQYSPDSALDPGTFFDLSDKAESPFIVMSVRWRFRVGSSGQFYVNGSFQDASLEEQGALATFPAIFRTGTDQDFVESPDFLGWASWHGFVPVPPDDEFLVTYGGDAVTGNGDFGLVSARVAEAPFIPTYRKDLGEVKFNASLGF